MNANQPDISLPKTPAVQQYAAIVQQSSTDAPTLTVLQNTYPQTITPTRESTGQYKLTLSKKIDPLKTTIIFPNNVDNTFQVAAVQILDDDYMIEAIRILVCDFEGTPFDNALAYNTLIFQTYN